MKSISGFEIKFLFLAHVPPCTEEKKIPIKTKILKKNDQATDFLLKIFDSAINDCKVEITFKSNGNQENEVRNLLLNILSTDDTNQKVKNGKVLAKNLHEITDARNGIGLFAIIQGVKQKTVRTVLCRFKGDEGLTNHGKQMAIEYLPDLFTKKSKHYKLAVFEDAYSSKSFWKGHAIDRQAAGNTYRSLSIFWIEKFLHSYTAITSLQGTIQFSRIVKKILSSANSIKKQEQIISAIVNLKNKRKNFQVSLSSFCKIYLSKELGEEIQRETNDDFYNTVFEIDKDVYQKEFGNTVLVLQDGIIAYIPTFQYDKHVTERANKDGTKTIVIEGRLENKKIHVKRKVKKIADEE